MTRKSFFKTALVFLFSAFALSSAHAKTSAYYTASYGDPASVASKLKAAGFQVLATYHPMQKRYLNVIVITNATLKKAAAKPKRGFAAIQKVLVDTRKKTVLTTNPQYWLKAFLQKDYNAAAAHSVKSALKKALGNLTPTKDALSSGDLAGYHFMLGMPYYEDMLVLKKGAKSVASNKRVFSLSLPNGSKLYGVRLPKSVESFVAKIGEDKALVLPFTVLIENGTAYALHAKYYLAISYPLLSMGQFMKISSAPGQIEEALERAVR
jgi:hypothetical protein